ncbi:hypothetical protein SKAU_G00387750 [Synaphobranchus kaupii]|uniref:Uncharacterized protein n=1 Tax=Synaphobranchus kaupii TaxID=118154 RepID=A0A9Q1EAT1_SYNKA|nr:hypothetical protein SKAU_G00387750 [Synaphobranchus kaupii]
MVWAWLIRAWESGPGADPVLRRAERDVSAALPGISSLPAALKAGCHSGSKSPLNGWGLGERGTHFVRGAERWGGVCLEKGV